MVGLDHYEHLRPLWCAVNDAKAVRAVLERHGDGTLNFPTPQLLTSTGPGATVTTRQLRDAVRALFADDAEMALLHFAGHGFADSTRGYRCAGDCRTGDEGLPPAEIVTRAHQSRTRNTMIVLDSRHCGAVAQNALAAEASDVSEGVTILTVSTTKQHAMVSPDAQASLSRPGRAVRVGSPLRAAALRRRGRIGATPPTRFPRRSAPSSGNASPSTSCVPSEHRTCGTPQSRARAAR